jgi:putative tricarboxylic transport membrane protein
LAPGLGRARGEAGPSIEVTIRMKLNDAVFGALFAALGAFVLWRVQGFPPIPGQQYGAGAFPGVIGAGFVAVGVLLVLFGLRRRAAVPWLRLADWTRSARHLGALGAVVLGVVAYILWADDLGFLLLAPVLLGTWLLVLRVRPALAIVVAIAASLVIWFAFYKLLRVPLPWGVLKSYAF